MLKLKLNKEYCDPLVEGPCNEVVDEDSDDDHSGDVSDEGSDDESNHGSDDESNHDSDHSDDDSHDDSHEGSDEEPDFHVLPPPKSDTLDMAIEKATRVGVTMVRMQLESFSKDMAQCLQWFNNIRNNKLPNNRA